jgi:hypothetical protein
LAGIPAVGVEMNLGGVHHTEAFCYLNDAWLHAEDITETFTDFFGKMNPNFVRNAPTVFDEDGAAQHYYSPIEDVSIKIIDIDEGWIGQDAERFMFKLLRKPFAYPNQKLTRGEVAKLLCNYIGVVPMRNEQIFSDVPVGHGYSSYIWVMNKLGIMGGVGGDRFNPDAELTVQEFAVMANRVIQWGKAEAEEYLKNWTPEIAFGVESILILPLEEIEDKVLSGYEWPDNVGVVTEESIAEAYARAEKRVEKFNPPANSTPKVFADSDKIASWAKPAVDEFSKFGILQGDSAGSDSRLNPTEPLSKTRFLVFMFKFEEKLKLFNEFTPTPVF